MGGFPFYALAIKTHRLDGRQKKNQQQRLEKKNSLRTGWNVNFTKFYVCAKGKSFSHRCAVVTEKIGSRKDEKVIKAKKNSKKI